MVEKTVQHIDIGDHGTKEEWMSSEIHKIPDGSILVVSEPPSTYHKVYGIYMRKTGDRYQPIFIVETEPEA